MTPTTFTDRAVASESRGDPTSGVAERHDRPSKRRQLIRKTFNRLLCEYFEASLLAAFSWVVSYLVTQLIHI